MLPRSLLLFALLVGGCTTVLPTPELESLNPVRDGRSFDLVETINTGMFQLVPGRYVATWTNELGTIYRGPRYGVLQNPGNGIWSAYEGGVWIPSATAGTELPRLVTLGGSLVQFNDRQSAIAASHPVLPESTSTADQAVLMAHPPLTVSGAAGVAIGLGIVYAVVDAEEKKVRGKLIFIPVCRRGTCEPLSFTPEAAASFGRAAVWVRGAQPR